MRYGFAMMNCQSSPPRLVLQLSAFPEVTGRPLSSGSHAGWTTLDPPSKQATVMTWIHLSIALIFSLLTASVQARGGSPETRKKVASMSQKQRDTIVGITLGVSIPLLLALVVT